jgi:hypothetical protein
MDLIAVIFLGAGTVLGIVVLVLRVVELIRALFAYRKRITVARGDRSGTPTG